MKTKKYTIEITDVDGKIYIKRTNDGFNAYEILGFVTHAQQEIIEQINGTLLPEKVERIFVEQDKPELKVGQKVEYFGDIDCHYWIEEIDETSHKVLLGTTESIDDHDHDDFWVYETDITVI